MAEVRTSAESLIAVLGDTVPAYADTLVRLRHRYLRVQFGSMAARARILGGERLSFDQEAAALYDATPPHYSDAHFDSLLTRLDSLLPGARPLAERYQRLRDRVTIPAGKVDTVFKTAIAACRARTLAHLPLPPGERFDLEYVKGTSWNAYNWYKGNYHSLIQVNLDFPIVIDRAIDLACHEGYPGHHVYNALLEQALVRQRGWVEISMYPLFSPQSLIAEGSANFGIDMAFPAAERVAFERDSLFPLAGLDRSLAETNAAVGQVCGAAQLRAQRSRSPLPRWRAGRGGGHEGDAAVLAGLARAGRQAGALHRYVPQLRHQLQPGPGHGSGLGDADGRRFGGRAVASVPGAALGPASAERSTMTPAISSARSAPAAGRPRR